jgi:hypothetical protein
VTPPNDEREPLLPVDIGTGPIQLAGIVDGKCDSSIDGSLLDQRELFGAEQAGATK